MSEQESNLSDDWNDYDLTVARQETADMEGDGTPWLKLTGGITSVRICPAPRATGRKSPFVERFMHYYVGRKLTKANKRVTVGIVCPRKHSKGVDKCGVCQDMWDKERSGDPVLVEAAKQQWAKASLLCNVVLPENIEAGIRVHSFSKKQKETLDEYLAKYGDYSHPTNGYEIDIKKTGEGIDSRYELFPGMTRRPLSQIWPELKADMLVDLESLVIVPSYAQTIAAMEAADGVAGERAVQGQTGPAALPQGRGGAAPMAAGKPVTPVNPRRRSVGDDVEARAAATKGPIALDDD